MVSHWNVFIISVKVFAAAVLYEHWVCPIFRLLQLLSLQSPDPRPPSTPPYCIMFPLLFVCLFKHRGKAHGWRPLHLFWSEGHVNRGAPVGTPQPPNPAFLPISRVLIKRGWFGWHTPPDTETPAVAPGVMRDSCRSCGTKWIPWPGAHERGLLVFFFSFNLYSCREGWGGTHALLKHTHPHVSTFTTAALNVFYCF